MIFKRTLLIFLSLSVSLPVMAENKQNYQASSIYSPGCNKEQIKQLAGEALVKISSQQNWANDTEGFIVTLT